MLPVLWFGLTTARAFLSQVRRPAPKSTNPESRFKIDLVIDFGAGLGSIAKPFTTHPVSQLSRWRFVSRATPKVVPTFRLQQFAPGHGELASLISLASQTLRC